MELNDLSKIFAILRQARRGGVHEDINQDDIDVVLRELPEAEVEKKLKIEQDIRKKELDSLEKSDQETLLKKKLAADSIDKIRKGEKSSDRKERIEAAKESERSQILLDALEEEEVEQSEPEELQQSEPKEIKQPEPEEINQPTDEDYSLSLGEEALPSLEEMNIDGKSLEGGDAWSQAADVNDLRAEGSTLSQEQGDFDDFAQAQRLSDDVLPLDDSKDASKEKENLEEPFSDDLGDAATKSEKIVADEKNIDDALEMDDDFSFVSVKKLSNFNEEEIDARSKKMKESLINPLLGAIAYQSDSNDLDEVDDFAAKIGENLEDDLDPDALDDLQDAGELAEDEVDEDAAQSLENFDDLFALDDADDSEEQASEQNEEEKAENQEEEDFAAVAAPAQSATQEEILSDDVGDDAKKSAAESNESDEGDFDSEEMDRLVRQAKEMETSETNDSKIDVDSAEKAEKIEENVEEDDFQLQAISNEDVDKLLSELAEDELFSEELDQSLDAPVKELRKEQDFETDDYEKSLVILNSYDLDNRSVILTALKSEKISVDDSNRVSEMILAGRDEQEVVSFVKNQLYRKNYKEDFKRDLSFREEEEETLRRYQKKERAISFFRLVFLGIFPIAIVSFFLLFYGIDMMHSEVLYRQSYATLENKRYEKGEKKFEEAYKVFPSMRWSRHVADLYIDRGIFGPAEKKYLQALKTNQRSESILTEYGEMLMIKGDFDQSWLKFQEALRYHPESIVAKEKLAQLYIEWGKKNKKQWMEGDKVLNELIFSNEDSKLFYYAKKLEIASLRQSYLFSNFYYDKIKSIDSDYVEKKSFRRYAKFLSDHYERINTAVKDEELDPKLNKKNTRIFFTMRELQEKMLDEDPNYLPFYHVMANWMRILGQDDKAKIWVDRGIHAFESGHNPVVFRENFSPTRFYNLQGKLFYQAKEITAAIDSFRKSTKYQKEDAFANYYLGRIELLQFDDIVGAQKKLDTAYFHWNKEKNDDYRDLVYSLGYVNYKQGLKEKDTTKKQRSLKLWHELLQDKKLDDSYSLGFALSLAYLSLKHYDLAEAFIDESIVHLVKNLDYYQKKGGKVPQEVLAHIKMLSDNYNNLGVVQISQALSPTNQDRYVKKQKAIEHFVDSITLKQKLNLLRGVPQANFNRINTFPQVSQDFLLADVSLPKALLP